jgi:hypothetical protein
VSWLNSSPSWRRRLVMTLDLIREVEAERVRCLIPILLFGGFELCALMTYLPLFRSTIGFDRLRRSRPARRLQQPETCASSKAKPPNPAFSGIGLRLRMEETMRPTTAFDDNVFDLNALLHPGTIFDHPRDVVSLSISEKHAILASWASDASAIVSCPALRAPASLKAPVTIDEILEALYELDGGPRTPPGGKPNRLCSTSRALAA